MTRIQINPNLRLDGELTMVDLDEDVHGALPEPFERVEVYEGVSGIVGIGWVTEVDLQERTVTLVVDWAGLTIPQTRPERVDSSVASPNMRLEAPASSKGPSSTLTVEVNQAETTSV